MNEITITRAEYDKMIRTQIAAKMAFRLLKMYVEKKWVSEDADMLLDEFGGDFE